MYLLTVLETRNLKSKCEKGHAPYEGSREEPSLASSCSGSCRQSLVFLVGRLMTPISASSSYGIFPVPVSLHPDFLLLTRTPVILDLGPILTQYDVTYLDYICKDLIYKLRSHSQVLVGHEFWGNIFNPGQSTINVAISAC